MAESNLQVSTPSSEQGGADANRTGGVTRSLGASARELRNEAKDMAQSVVSQAKGAVDSQIDRGADQLSGVAEAVRRSADELEEKSPLAARGVRQAASAISSVAASIKGRGLDGVVGAVDDFAHRQPAAFFGAAVLAGFALSRFLKSSAERREDDFYTPDDGYPWTPPAGHARADYAASATDQPTPETDAAYREFKTQAEPGGGLS
ncbi:gas vesicle protein [Rhodoligotrophos appendicifer]|uniref:hypothetical protein n=1 Tax=Rhodoligotrophos appendicifer TaxID=987056 RepID=UPI0011856B7F|nr:hypothetical protein [Rhodoligotrophos appendicifer]